MSALALVNIGNHDAGVASAMLNASQQVGGSLGTALLNTIYASVVTTYLVAHAHTPAQVLAQTESASIHGYHIAFFVGAGLMLVSTTLVAVLVNATKDDLQTNAAVTTH
jgi:hypothetical protein